MDNKTRSTPANDAGATPVIPLPNPGEGGPVYDPDSNAGGTPVIPLPNPGEGGPVYDPDSNDGSTPVIPLPNPGEGGPVYAPPGNTFPYWPGTGGVVIWPNNRTRVRFLNAAYGYQPFRILVNNTRAVNWLNFGAVSSYGKVNPGYQTITVTGPDGYIYIQKALPFQAVGTFTVAIINTAGGLDLLLIQDSCCTPTNGQSNFRVSNLARNTNPTDVALGDGRIIFGDIHYKETTSFKRIQPGTYDFFFAETDETPMPSWQGIETMNSSYVGGYSLPNVVASLYLSVAPNQNYTVYMVPSGANFNDVQLIVTAD